MKNLIVFIAFFFVDKVFSQSNTDTSFLLRKHDSMGYQAVFIAKPNSPHHNKLFRLLEYGKNSYEEKLKEMSAVHTIRKHKTNLPTIGDWISIVKYKGKKYGYFPSEPYVNLLLSITDSIIIENDFNDGYVPLIIKEVSRKENKIMYTLINIENEIITIEFTLMKNGMAKIKSPALKNGTLLMIKKESFFNLPLIVNYCPTFRCPEFDF